MNISDSRFNATNEFSKDQLQKLRSLANHEDGLDPEDCLIFHVQHLMKVQILLEKEGLISQIADLAEATKWRSTFLEKVQSSDRFDESNDLMIDFLTVLDQYIQTCEIQ